MYTPTNGENHKVEVELNGKSTVLICRKPGCRDMSCKLIIFFGRQYSSQCTKNPHTPESVLGLAVLGHGKLLNYCLLNIRKNTPVFQTDKTEWKAGVAQIVLFDTAGQIIADRLIFMRKPEPLTISVRKTKRIISRLIVSYWTFQYVTRRVSLCPLRYQYLCVTDGKK